MLDLNSQAWLGGEIIRKINIFITQWVKSMHLTIFNPQTSWKFLAVQPTLRKFHHLFTQWKFLFNESALKFCLFKSSDLFLQNLLAMNIHNKCEVVVRGKMALQWALSVINKNVSIASINDECNAFKMISYWWCKQDTPKNRNFSRNFHSLYLKLLFFLLNQNKTFYSLLLILENLIFFS